MKKKTIIEKIERLQPREAIHIGHSYLIINVAGIKIALDPSTETGFCTAPFCNLLPESVSIINSLRPLIEPNEIVPRSEKIADYIDVVLYSHLHSDHFTVSVLRKMVGQNPKIRIIWPCGTSALVSERPPKPSAIFMSLITILHKRKMFNGLVDGIFEYLHTNHVFDIGGLEVVELRNGSKHTLREDPFVEIRAFEVRHPKPQAYFKLPFESSNMPPVLGYEISYNEDGVRKKMLLIGETGTDPELLWNIWEGRHELVGVFIAVADESTTKGFKLIKDIYLHASLQIIALSERLSGKKTTIHCLHQGLWYYKLDNERVKVAREMLGDCHDAITETEIESKLDKSRKTRNSFFGGTRHLRKLIKAISCFNIMCESKVRLNSPGEVFTYGQEKQS